MGNCCSSDLQTKQNEMTTKRTEGTQQVHSKSKLSPHRPSSVPPNPLKVATVRSVQQPMSKLPPKSHSLVVQPNSSGLYVMSNNERNVLLADPFISLASKLILNVPFSTFSRFTEHIFITGIGGITLENLKHFNIKCLVNVGEEISNYNLPTGLISYKFPMTDNYTSQISDLMHSASDVMSKMVKSGSGNVVVYCTAGMSRSATIALAYAIKHLRAPLKKSFKKLQDARTYARPNLSFFQQLVHFEKNVLGSNSTLMVPEALDIEDPQDSSESSEEKSKEKAKKHYRKPKENEPSITVPDFYKADYPHLFKLEVEEALAGNCPMANNCQKVMVSCKTSTAVSTSACSASSVSALSGVSGVSGATSAMSKVGDKGKEQAVKTSMVKISMMSSTSAAYQTHELKPFILNEISYPAVLEEIDKARKKMITSSSTSALSAKRSTSPLSLKKTKK